jgi:dihydroflavonol-4-reductase
MNLVTGGTGLVGAHLLLYLVQKGEKVRALYRSESAVLKTKDLFDLYNRTTLFQQIEWSKGDLNDIPSLEIAILDCTRVYHCAALISFDPSDEAALRKVNIEGTANMVNLSLAFGIEKFCYVSSIAALGDLNTIEKVITEDSEWNQEKTHSDYAISKYGAEMEIWRAQQEGLACIIINPGVILGAGFWNSSSGEIFTKIKKGLPFYTKGTTGFVSVEDVIIIMYQLMNNTISGERFTIISENIDYKTLSFCIAENLKVKPPYLYAKPWMTSLASKIDWLLSIVLFQKRQLPSSMVESLHSTTQFSNKKIKETLSYKFQPIHELIKEISSLYS